MRLFNGDGCLNQSILYKTEACKNRVGKARERGGGEREEWINRVGDGA
jgi:hypothetical protein